MAITRQEAQEQILGDLGVATDDIALAVACLSEAYEQLSDDSADRLESELFRPAQKAFGLAKRTHDTFASRTGQRGHNFEPAAPGPPSQGPQVFIEAAVDASAGADDAIAALQDTMLPIESGDAELRAGLAAVRELLDGLPGVAREFVRTLGR